MRRLSTGCVFISTLTNIGFGMHHWCKGSPPIRPEGVMVGLPDETCREQSVQTAVGAIKTF
jgi:hypothetical protein